MSLFELLSLVASLIALSAVAWSGVLLRRQIAVAAEASLDVLFVAATEAYLDHPELRAVFNEGESGIWPTKLDRETTLRAAALAENLADAMERSLKQSEAGIAESGVLLRAWIKDSFASSAFFRAWLAEHREWYSDELLGTVDATRSTDGAPES